MESLHGFMTAHLDREPYWVGRGFPTAPHDGGLRTARPTSQFMESPLSFFRMHWDHEPTPKPSREGN